MILKQRLLGIIIIILSGLLATLTIATLYIVRSKIAIRTASVSIHRLLIWRRFQVFLRKSRLE
jgi:hypothetical protein